jgi:tRNA 2-thiouridine synthesizing protein A
MDDIKPDEVLDCRGLSCPMPILKIKKAMVNMSAGEKEGSGFIHFFVRKA